MIYIHWVSQRVKSMSLVICSNPQRLSFYGFVNSLYMRLATKPVFFFSLSTYFESRLMLTDMHTSDVVI